ncbi:Uncharacterised protein [uncultured archaeon]|nr:Uncharacterised protein [uncultured archaeon]
MVGSFLKVAVAILFILFAVGYVSAEADPCGAYKTCLSCTQVAGGGNPDLTYCGWFPAEGVCHDRRIEAVGVITNSSGCNETFGDVGGSCDIKDFPWLFKYGPKKNRNLATALYSISSAFKERNVEVTPDLLAAVMATLEKEVGGEDFLPVEENGDYGMGGNCSYKIGSKCRKTPYSGGVDYKGRGYIQITHKENYEKYCGEECVGNSTPELDLCGCKNQKHCTVTDENVCPQVKALLPEYAGRVFASYYIGTKSNESNLVELSEEGAYWTVGKKINGGSGYADDFSVKANNYLKLFKSNSSQMTQLIACLNASSNGDYCTKDSVCETGKECDLDTHTCRYKQAPPTDGVDGCESGFLFSCNDPVSRVIKRIAPPVFNFFVPECQQGYVYGQDRLCHPECGTGTYCTGDAVCYNGRCLSCDPGYTLGEGGLCYPQYNSQGDACDTGYLLGEDRLCHPECGNSGTYCLDSVCFNNQCLTCDPGYYLGTDGLCHPENGGEDDSITPG